MSIPFRFLFQPVRQFEKQFQGFRLNFGDGFRIHAQVKKETDFIRDFRQGLHLRLHGGDGGVQNRGIRQAGFQTEGACPEGEFFRRQGDDVLLVDPAAFGDIEFGGGVVHGFQREASDQLLRGENFRIVLGRPAQQGQKVHDAFRQKAFFRVGSQGGAHVALGHFGAVLVQNQRHVGENRGSDAEGLKQLDVLGRVHDVVFPANDVGHLHLNIVHHVDKVEDVGTVRAADSHVRGVGGVPVVDGDVSANQVMEGDGFGAVKAETPGSFILVHAAGVLELLEIGVVNIVALALKIGAAIAAFHGPLIPVQPQPFHAGEDCAGSLLRIAGVVRVFNAEDEGPPHLAGEQPVEQGGAGAPDVKVACGGRCESCSDVTHDG